MSKYLPHGTTVTFNGVAIGGLISVSLPSRAKGVAETTDSNSAYDREYIPGLREGGEVELTFRHNPDDAGQDALEVNYDTDGNAAVVTATISLPPDSITSPGIERHYTFDCFVTSPPQGELGLTDDEAAEASATLKVAGAVSLSSS